MRTKYCGKSKQSVNQEPCVPGSCLVISVLVILLLHEVFIVLKINICQTKSYEACVLAEMSDNAIRKPSIILLLVIPQKLHMLGSIQTKTCLKNK